MQCSECEIKSSRGGGKGGKERSFFRSRGVMQGKARGQVRVSLKQVCQHMSCKIYIR